MATELSNYDNDYRERYRGTTAPSITGWETVQAANVSVPMPDETVYGLYGDSDLSAGEAADSQAWPLPAASTDLALLPDPSKVTGAFQGRYSLDFGITEAGDVGEPLSIADFDVATGANPPASPSVGTLWYDTVNLALMVYIDDGNSLQWVQAN